VMASPTDPGGAVRFSGQGDRSGGVATPDMQMTALSRVLGPVAGTPGAMSGPQGSFKPADFFRALEGALLFGTIPLTEVLKEVGLDDPSKLPRFVTEGMSKLDGLMQDVSAAQDLVNAVSGGRLLLSARRPTLLRRTLPRSRQTSAPSRRICRAWPTTRKTPRRISSRISRRSSPICRSF
jgi:hypothetical protein